MTEFLRVDLRPDYEMQILFSVNGNLLTGGFPGYISEQDPQIITTTKENTIHVHGITEHTVEGQIIPGDKIAIICNSIRDRC